MWDRRRVLGVTAVAALAVTAPAGCGLLDSDPEPIPEPDPLQPVLDEALALASAYDRLAAARPDLAPRITPLAEDHRAHAAELTTLIGTRTAVGTRTGSGTRTASAGAAPSAAPPGDLAAMRAAEQAAARSANASARTAPADRAALVGMIAACRVTHAEALR
jgi:hypothetical protein